MLPNLLLGPVLVAPPPGALGDSEPHEDAALPLGEEPLSKRPPLVAEPVLPVSS